MLRKRLMGVVTVKDGWAVQSMGYKHYLPLGKPECIVENLDRWGVDEILVQVIDRSIRNAGPDIELLSKIANQGVSTPIIYAGGISTEEDAVNIIRAGADRICIDALLHVDAKKVSDIANRLGAQAIVACFPMSINTTGQVSWYNYRAKSFEDIQPSVLSILKDQVVSEIMIVDCKNEGYPNTFNFELLSMFSDCSISIIIFGGLSHIEQIENGLLNPKVSAVGVGNFLNYKEHSVQNIKNKLVSAPIRPPFYNAEEWA